MATTSLQAAYDQARSFLEQNKIEQAIAVAQHILEQFPDNLEAHRVLGEAYLAGRQFDQAEAAFSRVLHADPESIPALVGLGITFERQGRVDRAITEFERALEIRPDMPELRSQLLRLYTDVWGSEGASLRLSRSGLARLYAKGHMLPQAAQEFRSVIEEFPDRFDARVGLAEVLWRDGQEEQTAEVCEAILAERPDVLKANLLLGYIKLANGDERGNTYWQAAQRLEPQQQVARALFETLPDFPEQPLTLSAWDEDAWKERRIREEEEQRARAEEERRAHEEELRRAQAAQMAVSAPAAVPEMSGASDDDDPFGDSWMSALEASTPAPAARPAARADNDDFLASLLAFDSQTNDTFDLDEPAQSAEPAVDFDDDLEPFDFGSREASPATTPTSQAAAQGDELPPMEPFSLDELGLNDDEVAALSDTPQASTPPAAKDEPEMAPFSFEDLGLSPDEIASLEGSSTPAPAAPAAKDEPEMAPFSFEDLGLSPDEIASLEGSSTPTPAAPSAKDEPEMTPFSFEDLGLSPDEIASLEGSSTPAPAAPSAKDEPEMTPFSFEDLGLSPDEIASLQGTEVPSETPAASDEPDMVPFSLEDLGLSPDEIASLEGSSTPTPAAPSAKDEPEMTPFSFEDLGLSPDEIASLNVADPPVQQPLTSREPEQKIETLSSLEPFDWTAEDVAAASSTDEFGDPIDLPGELQPFSLDDLDLSAANVDLGSDLPPSLQPFSLDDVPPPVVRSPSVGNFPSPKDDPEQASYSWQSPSARKNTGFLRDVAPTDNGPSIFDKLKERHQELPPEPEGSTPSGEDEFAAGFFSDDDVSLREDDEGAATNKFAGGFRLPKEDEPVSSTRPAAAAPTPPPAVSTPPPVSDEPDMTPFSLEDLGLSPEEIAALEGSATPTAATPAPVSDEPDMTPFSLEDLGLSAEEIAALEGSATPTAVTPTPAATPAPVSDEPDMTPFSLEDLGLSAEEIAALEGSATPVAAAPTPAATPAPVSDEPELTPFSLEELGLSPEEVAALSDTGSGTATPTTSDDGFMGELDADPFSFDEFSDEPSAATPADDPFGGDVEPFSLDDLDLDGGFGDGGNANRELGLSVDELNNFSLGELDTKSAPTKNHATAEEELAAVDTGDPALDRLITLGQRQGFVDITDIIGVVKDPEAEAERIEEIGWILHRAGIQIRDGDEIIDMEAGDGETAEETDDEFAFAEETPATIAAAPTPSVPAVTGEPDLTPFSLEELGLSPEEIAALGLSEASAEPAAPAPTPAPEPEPTPAPAPSKAASDEPDMTPFSLEELGLSPEEIAALGLSEASAEPAAPAPTPAPEPAPTPAPAPGKAASDEPELTPFSLEELGLSPEEIAALEGATAAPAETTAPAAEAPAAAPAPSSDEPELTPFSLEELGLSPEEIAALEGGSLASEPALGSRITTEELNVGLDFGQELDNSLDFDVVDQAPVEQVARATRTAPRVEEPPPPVSPEDATFVPEPLDALDNIWDVAPPPVEPSTSDTTRLASRAPVEPPARVVLPPRQERPAREERPVRERPVREERPRRERPAREERSSSGSRAGWGRSRDTGSGIGAGSAQSMGGSLPKADLSPTSFIPTGDEVLDEYLRQIEAEPDNLGLRLAVARISAQTGRADVMAAQYRQLIKAGRALDTVVDEVQDLIAGIDDTSTERQLYRTLGDVYSRQGRLREAVAAYGHTV
jgi:tetratricopeptide (TPR) repeat protein